MPIARRIRAASSLVTLLSLLLLWPQTACARQPPPKNPEGALSSTQPQKEAQPMSPRWKEVDSLVDEQKYAEAVKVVDAIRAEAQAAGNDDEQARALIRRLQLRIGLGGYETAVREYKEATWPQSEAAELPLRLYYAQALATYLDAYSWEISRREQVASAQGKAVDLKAWTKGDLVAEAERTWQALWVARASLSGRPLAELSEYLAPNGYPPGIRDTLRDALTYMAASLLGNTAYWSADEENGVWRLPVDELLAEGGPRLQGARIDDAALHPLVRAVAVLDDLERFHAAAGQREAALEARLARARLLYRVMDGAQDRRRIVEDLRARLAGYREVPWWSMGMAELASDTREGDAVAARQLASEGEQAYPGSLGAARCQSIRMAIEAPDFSVDAMRSDGPKQRSLRVTHRNLAAVHFRAYRVDLDQRLATAKDYNLLPAYSEWRDLLAHDRPVASWTAALPPTPDYQSHVTWVTPPLAQPGLYVVLASAKADFSSDDNRIRAADFIVSDLVLVQQQHRDGGDVEATVLDGKSGQPVAGAEVTLYRFDWRSGHKPLATRKTDAQGRARYTVKGSGYSYFLLARRGDDRALDDRMFSIWRSSSRDEQRSALVYTDRSIYRPGQTLYWKAVAYAADPAKARWSTAPNQALTVRLLDGNDDEVVKKELKTNAFGSVAGEFTIPTGRLLGAWRIVTSYGGGASVRVEEYKRPTFEVSFREQQAPMRINRPAELVGEAKYYFGLPVTSGHVRWSVERAPVYPWWWGWWYPTASKEERVAVGEAEVGPDGSFRVKFTPEADERRAAEPGGKELSWRYKVSAQLTDEGGETRSAERTVRLGFVAVEARIAAETQFLPANQASELRITRTDLDGAPQAGAGSYQLYALVQPKTTAAPGDLPRLRPPADAGGAGGQQVRPYATPGDGLRPRWGSDYSPEAELASWALGAEQAHGALRHDDKGLATLRLPALRPGAYRVRYQSQDAFGAAYETWKDLVVAGPHGAALALPLYLRAERTSVPVGETARLLVTSGLHGTPLYYERYHDGVLYERKTLAGDAPLIEIPVGEADRGGFGVVVWLVRDHQLVSASQQVFVPWDDRALHLAFSTFRDKLRPGAKESFRITVKGPNDHAVQAGAAEVLAYMYDRSLDAFAPHRPPSLDALWPSRTGTRMPIANLGATSFGYLIDDQFGRVPAFSMPAADSLVTVDGYGIGGVGSYGIGGLGVTGYGRGVMRSRGGAPMMAAPAPKAMKKEAASEQDEDKSAPGAPPPPAEAEEPQPDSAGAPIAQQPAQAVRSNFAETAFFRPQLLVDAHGQVAIEFTVPDSVTSWNVWAHAVTKDLRGGSTQVQTRSVKELMVRPYLPRFFREGDRAELQMVVNNASDHPLSGKLRVEIVDPETEKDLRSAFGLATSEQPFTVPPGGGAHLAFPVVVPRRVGPAAFRVTATAGDYSDGELRPVPVLPGRMHLAQSRFVTLKDAQTRTLRFDDLAKDDDPSRVDEQLVVTLDAQLFYTVLKALPYLVEYPYECTEQTLNRFVSTGIVSTLYKDYPAVGQMAQKLAQRQTRLETFNGDDPNRKMALEETPWLRESRGGADTGLDLINVLDPKIAKAQRDDALAKLRKIQTSSGAFPWFPGGPPSPYMTLYLMYGFSKAAEFHVEVPRDMVQRGWGYLARHFREDYVARLKKADWGWEYLTFLNFVASSYPDPSWMGDALTGNERKEILDYSFAHWKQHSPYLKVLLALTLHRAGRQKDALLVFDSVMDSAKTEPDRGTFWAQEDRSWLWYNDTTETHAFALRALMELRPDDARKDGLVMWLLLDKKLNHWKSTRATAEVLYSLVKYLQKEGALGVREAATVAVGPETQTFTFEPDTYVGKAQMVVPGARIVPKTSSQITVAKQTKGVMFASATWHYSTDKLPAEERGDFFHVTRKYFLRDGSGKAVKLVPLTDGAQVKVGDQVEVQLSLRAGHQAEYVQLRDPRPAGFEPESAVSGYHWDLGIGWYEEIRDSGTNFFFDALPVGEYTFKYRLRANLAGTFRVAPAQVQSVYAPEFHAFSAGDQVSIQPAAR